jgi:hypothetical protein
MYADNICKTDDDTAIGRLDVAAGRSRGEHRRSADYAEPENEQRDYGGADAGARRADAGQHEQRRDAGTDDQRRAARAARRLVVPARPLVRAIRRHRRRRPRLPRLDLLRRHRRVPLRARPQAARRRLSHRHVWPRSADARRADRRLPAAGLAGRAAYARSRAHARRFRLLRWQCVGRRLFPAGHAQRRLWLQRLLHSGAARRRRSRNALSTTENAQRQRRRRRLLLKRNKNASLSFFARRVERIFIIILIYIDVFGTLFLASIIV